jgi:hypothetical protein
VRKVHIWPLPSIERRLGSDYIANKDEQPQLYIHIDAMQESCGPARGLQHHSASILSILHLQFGWNHKLSLKHTVTSCEKLALSVTTPGLCAGGHRG